MKRFSLSYNNRIFKRKYKEPLKLIEKEMNLRVGKIIGSGSRGLAFAVGDNLVLKLTKTKREYDFAKQIAGKPTKHLVQIHRVYKLDQYDPKDLLSKHEYTYAILMDRVEVLTIRQKMIIETLEAFTKEFYSMYRPISYLARTGVNKKFVKFINKRSIGLNPNKFLGVYYAVNKMYKEGLSHGIDIADIHTGNLGTKNGRLVMIDVS